MNASIDYYFSTLSTWAYIGHKALHEMAARQAVTINYRPMAILEVFEATETAPLPKRHPTRQRLRWMELQRWREKRGIKLNLQPAHWPFPCATADRMIVAAVEAGHDPADFIGAVFSGSWAEEKDMGDESVLADTANGVGLPGEDLLDASKGQDAERIYAENTAHALEAGVFGSPTYFLNGEMFWGQDRIDLLEEAISSGREPYNPL